MLHKAEANQLQSVTQFPRFAAVAFPGKMVSHWLALLEKQVSWPLKFPTIPFRYKDIIYLQAQVSWASPSSHQLSHAKSSNAEFLCDLPGRLHSCRAEIRPISLPSLCQKIAH